MLVEINKPEIDNQDVRSAIKTLREHGMHPFLDGYYHGYVSESHQKSLENDEKMMNPFNPFPQWKSPAGLLPAIYGCKFFATNDNQPARFYGSHLPISEQKVELVKVNP